MVIGNQSLHEARPHLVELPLKLLVALLQFHIAVIEADGHPDEGVLTCLEVPGRRLHPGNPGLELSQPGLAVHLGQPPVQSGLLQWGRLDPEPVVESLDVLLRRELGIVQDKLTPAGTVHLRIVGPLEALQTFPDTVQVPLLIAGLPLPVRFLPLPAQPVEPAGGSQQSGPASEQVVVEGRLPPGLGLGHQFSEMSGGSLQTGPGCRTGFDPGLQVPLQSPFSLQDVALGKPLQHSLVVLEDVSQAGLQRRILEGFLFPAGHRLIDDVKPFLEGLAALRIVPPDDPLDLPGQAVPVGAPRIARHQDQVAGLYAPGGDFQVMPGPIGNVLLRIVRRLSIRADIGAIEGVVPGVAGPHPVVDVAPVLADGEGRGIDQANVPDFKLLDQLILQPAEVAGDPASMPRVLLAVGNQGLLPVLDGLITLPPAGSLGNPLQHRPRDVLDRHRDQDAAARSRRKLLGPAGGQKALFQQISFPGGVVLDGAVGTVVVGDHQPLGRHERGRAVAEPDHRVHGVACQVRERLGIHLGIQGLQPVRQRRELARPPHPLLGRQGRGKKGDRGQQGQGRDDGLLHGRNLIS